MATIYFDTRYNTCTALFTDTNLFMNNVLTCQLIITGETTKHYLAKIEVGTTFCGRIFYYAGK